MQTYYRVVPPLRTLHKGLFHSSSFVLSHHAHRFSREIAQVPNRRIVDLKCTFLKMRKGNLTLHLGHGPFKINDI